MNLFTEIIGLDSVEEYFKRMPDVTAQAASLAINRTIHREGMKTIQDEMYGEVNFPKGYLKGDRLKVSQNATKTNLEGIIIARKRGTSLARFATPGTPIGTVPGSDSSVGVRVKTSGGATTLRHAWLVRLNKGKSTSRDEDQYNIGLAMRLRPGETVSRKHSTHEAFLDKAKTVALLYGPSVDQVFRDVREKAAPTILNEMAAEFFRQFDRLTK